VNDVVTGADIATCLQLELAAVEVFLGILNKEQDALIEGKIERVEALASDKAQVAGQLAELAAQRNRGLASRNLNPDSAGMEACLAGAGATAAGTWRDLLGLVQVAQQLNRTNGELIAVRLQHNQQALAALQGAAGAVSLYGPKGQQTLGFGGGRPLGRV
jgi:flagella synthesis protein FlgN